MLDKKCSKIIKILITIQIFLFPIIDILRTTEFRHVEIFNISVIELVNIILITSSCLLTIIKTRKTNKFGILSVAVITFLIGVYTILHCKHIVNFDTTIFPAANFNIPVEAFYIFRVYLLPLLLVFTLLSNKDIFDFKYYFKVLKYIIGFISVSIIVLDLFKISYISYSATHDFVTHNFIDYFLYDGDYKLLAARGWFDSSNELSAILLMLLPINILMLYKEQKKINIFLFVSQFFAMILLGTRTAALGSTMIFVLATIIYLFFVAIKKEKYQKLFFRPLMIFGALCTIYMLISPFMLAKISDSKFDFSVKNKDAYSELDNIENINDQDLKLLITKYSDEYRINEAFLELYPLSGDREFWIMVAKRDKRLNNNSRIMKTDILSRIKERNNNKLDNYYGLGYTLNFIDIERDYVYQYYLFGVLGLIILVFPYLEMLLLSVYRILKSIKKMFKYETFLFVISPALGLAIAYFSGHVFGWVSPMMWLGISLSMLNLLVVTQKEKNN